MMKIVYFDNCSFVLHIQSTEEKSYEEYEKEFTDWADNELSGYKLTISIRGEHQENGVSIYERVYNLDVWNEEDNLKLLLRAEIFQENPYY